VIGDDLDLYVAAGADGLDLITGCYDLAGCLRRSEPLVVPPEADPFSRLLGAANPARTMRSGQWRPRIAKEQWPFRLFLVRGHGQDDEMQGGIRISDGRVVAEDEVEHLYGPLGANVVAFVTCVVADWEAVEFRLATAFAEKTAPSQREPFSLA
jgi:hypothetical protein